jgi:DNA (cytosine-5)-methyltransferase 1
MVQKLKAISFFSGAMGLDLGLEKAGIEVLLACDADKRCRETIKTNKPLLPVLENILSYTPKAILETAGIQKGQVDIIAGGPPCQAFSTAGGRKGFQDPRGNLFLSFLNLIEEIAPRYVVIENVRGLLSASISSNLFFDPSILALENYDVSGGALLYVIKKLESFGYTVTFNLYNAANFGVPQIRERIVIIATQDSQKVPHLFPTHSNQTQFNLPNWVTLKEALASASDEPQLFIPFPEKRRHYYEMLKEGQYWKHLPESMQKKALGKAYYLGGGKTGFLRRLSWEKPSCTLVTHPAMPATDICHPTENRPLSVQEYKKIQQFPDSWIICGSILEQYRQIGNAVPVGLGEAIGKCLADHSTKKNHFPPLGFPFSRYKNTDEASWIQKHFPYYSLICAK